MRVQRCPCKELRAKSSVQRAPRSRSRSRSRKIRKSMRASFGEVRCSPYVIRRNWLCWIWMVPRGSEAQSLDSLPCLDICELTRAGVFDPPGKSRRWDASETVADLAPFSRSDDLLIFGYHAVQIVSQPCRFGGHRSYLACDCRQRVTKLYARDGGDWLCR